MKDVKIITPDDLGEGIVWNAQTKKYEASAQVLFTGRNATVDLLINGTQLLFRELSNSNRLMVVTGVRYQGTWYGDSPEDKPAIDPFSGKEIVRK